MHLSLNTTYRSTDFVAKARLTDNLAIKIQKKANWKEYPLNSTIRGFSLTIAGASNQPSTINN